MAEIDPYFVPTKSTLNGSKSYTCVVHELSKRESVKIEETDLPSSEESKESSNTIQDNIKAKWEQNREMKKLRFDVYKFARTGLKAKDKFTADKELAIRLGAERPKREGRNYLEVKKDVEKRKRAAAELKAAPSAFANGLPYDPYKTHFSLTKKMRIDRKKGNIGGMLSDYGKPIVKHKSKNRFKR